MAIAIIGNQSLMPRAFRLGLNQWSQTDGRPGSPTWAGAANAAVVPADHRSAEYILPSPFDPNVVPSIAKAVADTARESGMTR